MSFYAPSGLNRSYIAPLAPTVLPTYATSYIPSYYPTIANSYVPTYAYP